MYVLTKTMHIFLLQQNYTELLHNKYHYDSTVSLNDCKLQAHSLLRVHSCYYFITIFVFVV